MLLSQARLGVRLVRRMRLPNPASHPRQQSPHEVSIEKTQVREKKVKRVVDAEVCGASLSAM